MSGILITLAVPKFFIPSQIQEDIPGAMFLCFITKPQIAGLSATVQGPEKPFPLYCWHVSPISFLALTWMFC